MSPIVVLVAIAACLASASAEVYSPRYLRYVSSTKWNTSYAMMDMGLDLPTMAANDIAAVVACISTLPAGSVIAGIAGSAINENFVNGVNTPEWGSYTKVIHFKDYPSQQLYDACPSFTGAPYLANTKYILEKSHYATLLNPKESILGFPNASVYHVSLANAIAGNDTASVAKVVALRKQLNAAMSGMVMLNSVTMWRPEWAKPDGTTTLTMLGFMDPQGAIAYKAYKSGNPPGPVGTLPLYTEIKAVATPSHDLEIHPVMLMGN